MGTAINLSDAQAMSSQKDLTDGGSHTVTITAYPQLPSNGKVFVTSGISSSADCDLLSTPADVGLSAGECVFLRSEGLPGVHCPTLADLGVGANSVLTVEFIEPSSKDSYQMSHQTHSRSLAAASAAAPAPASQCIEQQMGGFAAGGRISDTIYPDLGVGPRTWDMDVQATATVHLVNSQVFTETTSLPMPATALCEQDYKEIGLPRHWRPEWANETDSDGIFSVEQSALNASTLAEFTSRSALLNSELLRGCR